MTVLYFTVIGFFILLCALLTLIILVQESKSMGLGASFGGDPGESVFGTSTAEVLKKMTAYLALVFMVACVVLSLWSKTLGTPRTKVAPTIEEIQ